MENTKVVFCDHKDKGRERLLKGASIVNRAVGATMGPKGKLVLLKTPEGKPIATKDGVTVSKSINLKHDTVEDLGAKLIQEAAWQTNEKAGDGTTTATVLAYEMMKRGNSLLAAQISSRDIVKGMESALDACLTILDSQSEKISDSNIEKVAFISANNDSEIAKIVANAVKQTTGGIVTVEESKNTTTTFHLFEGIHFDKGYTSPYFINNSKSGIVEYKNAKILLIDGKINSFTDIIKPLEVCARESAPLLVIADDFEGDSLQGLITNRNKTGLSVVAVRSHGQGHDKKDFLKDISVISGCKIFTPSSLSEFSEFSSLGNANKIEIGKVRSTIIANPDNKDAIKEHISNLNERRKLSTLGITGNHEDVQKLTARIAKLKGAVGVIRTGGATETEMIERKHRIEDAVNATQSAVAEGIVSGGGIALVDVYKDITSHSNCNLSPGQKVVIDSLLAPFTTILQNAGFESAQYLFLIKSQPPGTGFDVFNENIVPVREMGIIDPVRVTKTALIHAVSVACTFISLDAIITD